MLKKKYILIKQEREEEVDTLGPCSSLFVYGCFRKDCCFSSAFMYKVFHNEPPIRTGYELNWPKQSE